jgi:hypothetical protein
LREDTEQAIDNIIEKYDDDKRLLESNAYEDGGTSSLFARLSRAALNQANNGEATLSRYGIWSNTVRDHISLAIRMLESGNQEETVRLLTAAHNSLSAFADIQSILDPNKEV